MEEKIFIIEYMERKRTFFRQKSALYFVRAKQARAAINMFRMEYPYEEILTVFVEYTKQKKEKGGEKE